MRVKFTVPGVPQGKLRPRFRRQGEYVRAYTDENTVSYENLVKLEYQQQCPRQRFEDETALEMRIMAYFAIPGSISKKKQAAMEAGEIRPTIKADIDNICKIICDGTQGVAFKDDKTVVFCQIEKYYSRNPRVEVEISDEIA